jgi:hypothetical protein
MDQQGRVLNEGRFQGNTACYQQLKTAIRDGSAIAFTGSGTSAPLYPTWTKSLHDFIIEANAEGLIEDIYLQELYDQIHSDPLELAAHLEEIFTRYRFRDRLATMFGSKNQATLTHSLLIQLPFKGIVTLNYDDGLETAYSAVTSGSTLTPVSRAGLFR